MVLHLNPTVPLLWRSPSTLQLGSDRVLAVLDDVTSGQERLVAALAAGVTPEGYRLVAGQAEVDAATAAALLAELDRALDPAPTDPLPSVLVTGAGALALRLAAMIGESGRLADSVDAPGLVLLVADWIVSPADHARWLNRDIPHLPIVLGDRGVTIGPFVEPGSGPCLHCVHLRRTDDDSAWPVLATQLWGRDTPGVDSVVLAEATAFVCRRIADRDTNPEAVAGRSWRLDLDGTVTERQWSRHPECSCAAPAGTDWGAATGRATPRGPRSDPAHAWPA